MLKTISVFSKKKKIKLILWSNGQVDYCAIAASNFTPWPLLLDSMQMQMDAVKWTKYGGPDGRTDILCGTTPLLFMLIFCELKNGRVETGEDGGGAVVGRILLVLLDGLCCGSFVSLLCMSEILKS